MMDRIDRQIVSILQKNARTPLKVIAEKAYLSSPAVSARIERLEKAGIIKGYSAQVNVERLGYVILWHLSIWRYSRSRKISFIRLSNPAPTCWSATA